jgi:hypothetical protein
MSNMSYCRFHNTLLALQDCYWNMSDNDLSEEEKTAQEQLIVLCKKIASGEVEE